MTWLTFSIFLDHAAEFPALQRDIRSISIQNNSNIRFGKKARGTGGDGKGRLTTRYNVGAGLVPTTTSHTKAVALI